MGCIGRFCPGVDRRRTHAILNRTWKDSEGAILAMHDDVPPGPVQCSKEYVVIITLSHRQLLILSYFTGFELALGQLRSV